MNVVFDIGGVLVDWNPRYLYRKIFADEARMEWFLANVCTNAWNLQQDLGRSFAEGVAELTATHPDLAAEIRAYDQRWEETVIGAVDGTVELLDVLCRRGTPLYAITNFNQDKLRLTRARFPFLGCFRDTVISGDEGVIKPDPAIYRILLERNALAAGDCLFIDDSAKNVEGARAVGMQAVHFTTPDQLRSDLADRGLL